MAMAHPNPGLGKRKVTRHYDPFRRVTSAPPDLIRLRQMIRPLDADTVKIIRQSAKNAWKNEATRNKMSVTTYEGLHTHKLLDEQTQERVRPSSRNRMNKPHPPTVFLVTRAKKVDGCYEPDEAAAEKYGAKSKLDLDRYVAEHKNEIKRAMKGFPMERPVTSMEDRDRERTRLQSVLGPVPAQAAEAWIKLSNSEDQMSIRKQFKETEEKIKRELESNKLPTTEDYLNQQAAAAKRLTQRRQLPNLRSSLPEKGEQIYSTTRWLKKAGQAESNAVKKLAESIRNAPPPIVPMQGPHFHITDYSSMFASAPKSPHYDFQIHPEWHMPWHKRYVAVQQ